MSGIKFESADENAGMPRRYAVRALTSDAWKRKREKQRKKVPDSPLKLWMTVLYLPLSK